MRHTALLLLSLGQFQLSSAQREREFETIPRPAWKFSARGPIVSSPVISGSTVYVGSTDSVLYALDLDTGTPRWELRTGGPIRSTVCTDGERIFLVGGDGLVRCIDGNSGREVWVFHANGERRYEPYGYADYYHSSPAIHGNALFFGSGDSCIYALNRQTGDLLWRYRTDDIVHSSPVIDNDRLFVGSFDGHLYALRLNNGELLWKFKSVGHRFFPKGEMQGSPVVGNGLVYVGGRDYNVYAIDREKGYCHWNRQFPLGWAMALSCPDTMLFIGTSDDDLMLAVDGRTGKEQWRTNVHFNIFGTCAFADSLLYFGTLHGNVHAMDRATGTVRWIFPTDGFTAHHARYFPAGEAIVKNDFYAIVQTPEGYLRALCDLGAIFSRPAIARDRVIITSMDGKVYCLGR